MTITVETENQVAVDSPDHIAPYGVVRDNSTDLDYINAVKSYFGKSELKVLDLGCAGGQLVADFIANGVIAVGLEGSTNALEGAGALNWSEYLNKNLFFCDLTKPYQVQQDGKPMKFDFVTSWEVVEHIAPEDLKDFFDYIKNHMSEDGVFCCSIALYPSYGEVDGEQINLHQSMFNPAKWLNIIYENGFELCLDPSWPPMPQKNVPAGRVFDPALEYDSEADEGVVFKSQGIFFGYLFKDSLFRNHDRNNTSIYFCLRKKQG